MNVAFFKRISGYISTNTNTYIYTLIYQYLSVQTMDLQRTDLSIWFRLYEKNNSSYDTHFKKVLKTSSILHSGVWFQKIILRKRIRDFFPHTMQRRTVPRVRHSRLSFFVLLLFIACLPPSLDATQVNIAVTNNNVNTIVNSDTSVHTLKPG